MKVPADTKQAGDYNELGEGRVGDDQFQRSEAGVQQLDKPDSVLLRLFIGDTRSLVSTLHLVLRHINQAPHDRATTRVVVEDILRELRAAGYKFDADLLEICDQEASTHCG